MDLLSLKILVCVEISVIVMLLFMIRKEVKIYNSMINFNKKKEKKESIDVFYRKLYESLR